MRDITIVQQRACAGIGMAAALVCVAALVISGCSTAPGFPLADDEIAVLSTRDGVEFVRTPDAFFEGLPDWPYEPRYVQIDGLRQAYIDEGPRDGEPVLLLHGQPSWSYLYRRMIPVLADAGYRVIAMDHLGMGRSDKPISLDYHSYANHVRRLERFIDEMGLTDITAFVQDWGSLIGLNVIGTHPERFARVVLGNGALPAIAAGERLFPLPEDVEAAIAAFARTIRRIPARQPEFYQPNGDLKPVMQNQDGYFGNWILYARHFEGFRPSTILEAMTYFPLTREERDAYDAPFPARVTMAAPRTFPGFANTLGGQTQAAWLGLVAFAKPFLTIWAANDPGELGRPQTQRSMIERVPGAVGQPHVRLPEASHFLQDDQGNRIAGLMIDWMRENPIRPAKAY